MKIKTAVLCYTEEDFNKWLSTHGKTLDPRNCIVISMRGNLANIGERLRGYIYHEIISTEQATIHGKFDKIFEVVLKHSDIRLSRLMCPVWTEQFINGFAEELPLDAEYKTVKEHLAAYINRHIELIGIITALHVQKRPLGKWYNVTLTMGYLGTTNLIEFNLRTSTPKPMFNITRYWYDNRR